MSRQFDLDLKQHVFVLEQGQRIQLPPNPSHQKDFQGNSQSSSQKQVSVTQAINTAHSFLIIQCQVPVRSTLQMEILYRDQNNVSPAFTADNLLQAKKKLVFMDQARDIQSTAN